VTLTVSDNSGADRVDVTIAASGTGGGVDWNLDVDEDGSTFTNWTGVAGTWSSTGTVIQNTDTAAANKHARYNTALPLGFPFIVEADLQITGGSGSDRNAGLLFLYDGATDPPTGAAMVVLKGDSSSGTQVRCFRANQETILEQSQSFTYNTWYTLRVVCNGRTFSVYLDGAFLLTAGGANIASQGNQGYVGLATYGASAEWRNIKTWTLSTGTPA
ncbi:MAG: DUF1080 domain-containing protein, partial [Gemmatimonadota bacterium]|nr:DUF1080 domain-containing protein [Gemmatimonadota bacterium]